MEYKVTRYENYGQGFKEIFTSQWNDKESKEIVKEIVKLGYKRVRGSGIIGLTYEGTTEDKFGKVQITIERVVD